MLETEFNLRPSRIYIALLAVMLLISLGVILSLPVILRVPGLVFLSIYGAYLFWCVGLLRGHDAVLALKAQAQGEWDIKTGGKKYSASLCGDSLVTPYVAVLRFKVPEKRGALSCVIFPDALPTDDYRKLLVVCRG